MIDFTPIPECMPAELKLSNHYKYDYEAIFRDIANGVVDKYGTYKSLILNDLFFIVYFIFNIPNANHPFVIEKCKEVESGPDGWTLDLWARGHFKSSILTKARTIQRILKYPERCTMIASHTRPIAKKFLRPIMQTLELNETLKKCFPNVLYANPRSESPKWSEDDGIVVKRKSTGRNESTVEAWGVVEGMPISVHFDWIILDDLETKDSIANPDVVMKIRSNFDLTNDLLTAGGSMAVVGTPYSHEGIYIPFVRDKVKGNGEPAFLFRRHPATEDGLPNGKPVMVTKEELDDIRARKGDYEFYSQQLCDPTPVGVRKLSGDLIQDIDPQLIPKNIYKFMPIDPAGDDKTGKGDSWAFGVIGVEPQSDELGASNIYITDLFISPLREEEAPIEIARMYRRGGLIMQVGVEKVGLSTAEIHVANALAKFGVYLSVDMGSLVILRPHGGAGDKDRTNRGRIDRALPWPLYNSKIFISTSIPSVFRDRLRMEADKFPFWHDDGLTILAYFYDMIKDYHFGWWNDDIDEEDDRKVVNIHRNATTGY